MRQLIAVIVLSLLLNACVLEPRHRHGLLLPPVPVVAPLRRGGVDLVFDSGLGVYAVTGFPGIYFHDDLYWHMIDGRWHSSRVHTGGWVVVNTRVRHLPPGLVKKYGYGHAEHRDHDDDRDDDHDEHGNKHKHHD